MRRGKNKAMKVLIDSLLNLRETEYVQFMEG